MSGYQAHPDQPGSRPPHARVHDDPPEHVYVCDVAYTSLWTVVGAGADGPF